MSIIENLKGAMNQNVSNTFSSSALIPNTGHAFAEENPASVSDRLIRFFDSE